MKQVSLTSTWFSRRAVISIALKESEFSQPRQESFGLFVRDRNSRRCSFQRCHSGDCLSSCPLRLSLNRASFSASLSTMIHRLHAIPVGIDHVGGIVVGVIVRTETGGTVIGGARGRFPPAPGGLSHLKASKFIATACKMQEQ